MGTATSYLFSGFNYTAPGVNQSFSSTITYISSPGGPYGCPANGFSGPNTIPLNGSGYVITVTVQYNETGSASIVFAPTLSVASSGTPSTYGSAVTFTATISSGPTGTLTFYDSGVSIGTGTISGTTATFTTSSLAVGTHSITAGWAGNSNYSAVTSSAISQVVNAATPTISVATSGTPSSYGVSVTFTATVSSGPTGTVTFYDSGTSIGTSTLSGTTATFSTSSLALGTHSITAGIAASTDYNAATSSAISQVVNKATPTITWATPSPITYGTALSATQLDATASVAGTFAYSPASGTVLAGGSQTLMVTFTPTNTTDYNTATDSVTLTVNPATPTISVATSGTPSTYGGSVTFTATLSSGPTGTVTFYDSGASIGTGTISGTTATFTTSSLAAATHSITAGWAGNSNYNAVTSSAISQVVNKATPTISVATSGTPSTYGGSVTFTATVSSGPTGTVTFYDSGTSIGTGTISGTTATFATSSLAAATHSITAGWAGNSNYNAVTSSAISQVVNKATPTISVATSGTPSTYGVSVTFTATVSSGPTGTVTFYDSGTSIGTGTISGTTATFATGSLAVGAHTITAGLAASTDYNAVTSASISQVVNGATQTITFTQPTTPVTYGVSPIALSATASSGLTVTFSVLSGPATVSGSTLTITGVGSVTVAANQAGNSGYSAAAQVTKVVVVNRATLTVTANNASRIYGAANPAFTYSISGFVNGDSAATSVTGAPSLTTTATTSSAVGTYPITAAIGTLASANYTFTFVNGTLTITTSNTGTFTLTPASGNAGVFVGTSNTWLVTSAVSGGFSAPVTFSAVPSTLPPGVTASITPLAAPGSGTATVTFYATGASTADGASAGNPYKVTITGTGGGVTQTATITLYVYNFALSASPASTTVVVGNNGTSVIADTMTSGALDTSVALTAAGMPTGVGVSFSPSASAAANGSVTMTMAVGSTTSAGVYPITITGTAGGTTRTTTVSLTVSATKTPTLSVTTSNSSITFGSSVTFTATIAGGPSSGSVTFFCNGAVIGTGSISGTTATLATSALPGGSNFITASFAGNSSYNPATSGAITETVGKATPTIVWTTQNVPYGMALNSLPLTALVSGQPVAGTFTFPGTSETSITLTGALPQASSLAVNFTPAETENYNSTTGTIAFTVIKAVPAIVWATPTPISYGTALSTSNQLNAQVAGGIAGSFTYAAALGTASEGAVTSGTVLAAGPQILTATFTPTNSTDYTNPTDSVVLNVTKAEPTITWTPPASITDTTSVSTVENATASVAGSFAYSPSSGTLTAGDHLLTATFTPTSTANYETVTATVSILVTGATYDTGTVTLTVGGATAAKANYGQGDTPSSVAENLAASSSSYSSSGVAVAAVDDSISVVATGRGTASDLSYTLTAVTNNPTSFSHPSFAYPTLSGALDGGAGTDTTTTPIYTFCTAGSASPNCSLSGTGYDPAGNLLKYSDNVMGVWNFQYDTLNRLAGATDTAPASGAITGVSADYCWTYDAFGNRTTQAGSTTVFTNAIGSACATTGTLVNNWATYNTNNQITGTPQAVAGPTYDPSGAGYILNDGVNQYLYDAEGRICAVAATPVAGITAYTGYLYDADGTRIAKGTITSWSCDPTKNGFTTTNDYVLGLGGEQLTEMGVNTNTGGTSNTLTWQHANVWAGGKLLGTYDKDGLHFYFDDPLGTRRAQTDSVGVPEQTCTSLPYGDDLNCSGGNLQAPTEHHFTGKERDVESGNDYFGARYYASSAGRWLSPDKPFADQHPADPQSWNLYIYGTNNPLGGIDPNGQWWIFSSAVDKAERKIDMLAKTAEPGKHQTFFIDLCGIPGLHFHASFPEDRFNGRVGKHTSENSQRVGNWHLWPGWLGAAVGMPSPIQTHNAIKIADYAISKGLGVSSIGYSNGVEAQGQLADHFETMGKQMDYSLSLEPAASLDTLLKISGASHDSNVVRADNDPALFLPGLVGVAASSWEVQEMVPGSTITHTGTHKSDVNMDAATKSGATFNK